MRAESGMLACMVTPSQVRKVALALPEAEEKSHFGQPDFRVRNKIFGGLSRDLVSASMKLPSHRQAQLVQSRPDVFNPAAGAWGRSGWTIAELEGLELDLLRELLELSWRGVAPRRLVEQSEARMPSKQLGGDAKSAKTRNQLVSKKASSGAARKKATSGAVRKKASSRPAKKKRSRRIA